MPETIACLKMYNFDILGIIFSIVVSKGRFHKKKSSKKCGEGRFGKSPDFLLDFFVKPSLIR